MPDYLPRGDVAIKEWCERFASRVLSDPQRFAVAPERAQACWEAVGEFALALSIASTPDTRTTVAVAAKERCRAALVRQTRQIAVIIKAQRLSGEDLATLGLRPRATRYRRVGRPAHAPLVSITDVKGSTLTLRLQDRRAPANRGMPEDVSFASLYGFVGDQPPAGRAAWTMLGMSSRARFRYSFGDALAPGTRVWIAAAWSHRARIGPMSNPVMTYIHHPDLQMSRTTAVSRRAA